MKTMKQGIQGWLVRAFPLRIILMWTGIITFALLSGSVDILVFLGIFGVFINVIAYHQENKTKFRSFIDFKDDD